MISRTGSWPFQIAQTSNASRATRHHEFRRAVSGDTKRERRRTPGLPSQSISPGTGREEDPYSQPTQNAISHTYSTAPNVTPARRARQRRIIKSTKSAVAEQRGTRVPDW